jgi:hypothetical protein
MKKLYFLFLAVVLFGFAWKTQASYVQPNVTFPYVKISGQCGAVDPSKCYDLAKSLQATQAAMNFRAYQLLWYPGFVTEGYTVMRAFDTAYDDIGNTTPLTMSSPQGLVPITNCSRSNACVGYPSFGGSYCGDPASYDFFLRAGALSRDISCSHLSGGVGSAYWDVITGNLPVTVCEFGVPLGNRLCPNLPDIKINGSDRTVLLPAGQSANISWTTENSIVPNTSTNYISSCSVSPAGWTGFSNGGISTGALSSNTTYTLNCLNVFGQTYSDSVNVNVSSSLPTANVDISVDNVNLKNGESTNLHWSYSNADSCTITPPGVISGYPIGSGNISTGSLSGPRSYTYNISCNSAGGNASKDVTVNVAAPVVITPSVINISAESVDLPNGESTNIHWSYSGADSCTITPPGSISGYPDGSGSVSTGNLTSSRTYTLSCNPGPAASSVTVNVRVPNFGLNIVKTGQGRVVGNSEPAQTNISCGSLCQAIYSDETVITLIAIPDSGRIFIGWGGACSGKGLCSVTINSGKTVTAKFAVDPNYGEF